jgi:hypothetical protein
MVPEGWGWRGLFLPAVVVVFVVDAVIVGNAWF